MKLVDRPTVQTDIEIDADRSVVWSVITDPTRIGEFSPECHGGQWDEISEPGGVGATFTCTNTWGTMTWTTTSTVTQWEPQRAFTWVIGTPDDPSATWRYQLHPLKGNRTRLVSSMEFGNAPSGTTARVVEVPEKEEFIVAARTAEHHANMSSTLTAIKAAVEAAS